MSERTEAPTGKKLNEARSRGEVARSMELNTAVILLGGVLVLQGPGQSMVTFLKTQLSLTISNLSPTDLTEGLLTQIFTNFLIGLLPSFGLILIILLAIGAGTTLAQTNFLWAKDKLKPKFGNLNPLNGLKRIFSNQGLIELGRSLLKLVVVGWAAYTYLNTNIEAFLGLGQEGLATGVNQFVGMAIAMALRVGSAYMVLAILDYVYQRWNYMRSMRMTKEEVKEEYKQQEGDPVIRGRIRAQQRRLARRRMMSNVKKASVVITNPTHLAVAIEYDASSMNAPRVVAKGAYKVAERIVRVARDNKISVVQNIPLARVLYKNVGLDQEIPPDFYTAVAEILAYVYRIQGKSIPSAASQPA
jgi:flagellar biosynthetic protein FlhB